MTSVSGTANEISSTGGTTPVLAITSPFTFPGRFKATAPTTGTPSANFPTGTAPTTPTSGDFFNASNVLNFYDGTILQKLITDGGNSLTAASIPTVAVKTNQLSAPGPTIDSNSNIGSLANATGTGTATFAGFTATGSSLGKLQFFNPSNTSFSVTMTPAASPTSAFTLLTPDTEANDTLVSLAATQTLTNKTLTSPTFTTSDSLFTLTSATDASKVGKFSAGKISASTTRTLVLPDVSAVLLAGGINTVAFSSMPTFDPTAGTVQQLTLTGAVTSSTLPSGTSLGQRVIFYIVEGGVGGFSFVFPTNMKGTTAINTAAGKSSTQAFFWNGASWIAEGAGTNF